jgi:riboflavin biosynthesis pyrimidine reductase
MKDQILQVYPQPTRDVPLLGLYLGEDLLKETEGLDRPFVYTNYIQSLDGRIAIPSPSGSGMTVPKQIANERDWRLFQELAVQADIMITSGRYLRDYASGKAQEILRVYETPGFEDLGEWRAARGLPPYPDLVVISGSLDFPLPEVLVEGDRTVIVATTETADPDRRRKMEALTEGRLFTCGEERVTGSALVSELAKLGYSTIFNSTGPKVNHLLLQDQMLDRFYLTQAFRILGGVPFSSIIEGPLLDPPVDFKLRKIYIDPIALEETGQLFLSFDQITE